MFFLLPLFRRGRFFVSERETTKVNKQRTERMYRPTQKVNEITYKEKMNRRFTTQMSPERKSRRRERKE